jgi:hypothetical protein
VGEGGNDGEDDEVCAKKPAHKSIPSFLIRIFVEKLRNLNDFNSELHIRPAGLNSCRFVLLQIIEISDHVDGESQKSCGQNLTTPRFCKRWAMSGQKP